MYLHLGTIVDHMLSKSFVSTILFAYSTVGAIVNLDLANAQCQECFV